MKNSTFKNFEELPPVPVIVRDRHQVTIPSYWRNTLSLDQLKRLDPGSVIELVVRLQTNGGGRGKQSTLEDGVVDEGKELKKSKRKPPG